MLLLSQRGQPQKWYNQYGNVSCNTVCQLFNQPKKKKNQKVYKQSGALSSRPMNFMYLVARLSHVKYLNIRKLFPEPYRRPHLA